MPKKHRNTRCVPNSAAKTDPKWGACPFSLTISDFSHSLARPGLQIQARIAGSAIRLEHGRAILTHIVYGQPLTVVGGDLNRLRSLAGF